MKTISISCNSCGGELTPPEGTNYVTCSFCGTRLQICHEGNAYFSRAMEAIAQNTEKMSGDLDVIKIQNEIERLDREWRLEREKYLIHHKNGSTSEPGGSAMMILFLFFWIGFGVFMTALFMDAPVTGMWLVPAGITLFGVFGMLSSMGSGEKFQTAQQEYLRKRAVLLQKLPSELTQ